MADDTTHAPTTSEEAADTQTESGGPSVTVDDAGPSRKKLHVEVPAEQIQSKFDENYAEVEQKATLPGFRPGKAPMRLLKKRFGKRIRDDVRRELLGESLQQAIEQQSFEAIGEPDLGDPDRIELPESGPMSFDFEVDIKPEIALPDFSSLHAERPSAHVSDKDVEDAIENLRQRNGTPETLTEGEVEEGDFLTGPAKVLAGNEAEDGAEILLEQDEANVMVHGESADYRGHIAQIVIDDLGKRLAGKPVGHTERISMTGPEKHENERIQGQPITVIFTINQRQRVEPASIEDLIGQIEGESEEELRQAVRDQLESEVQRNQRRDMAEQVEKQLIDRVEARLPEKLVENRVGQNVDGQRSQLKQQGMDEVQVQAQLDASSDEDRRHEAERQIKRYFILEAVADQLNVEADENRVNQFIVQQAMQYGARPQELMNELSRSGQIEELRTQMRQGDALDAIVDHAQTTDVDRKPGEGGEDDAQVKDEGDSESEAAS